MVLQKSIFTRINEGSNQQIIHILCIDDDEDFVNLTSQYLHNLSNGNIKPITSLNAKEALLLIKVTKFDVIISDYQMPDMTGLELLQELREQGNNTPFIIFTGHGKEEVVIQALNLGANFYLQKGGESKALFTELLHHIILSTEKKRAESNLQTLINALPDLLFQLDKNGKYLSYKGARDDLYVPPEFLIGKTLSEVLPQDVAQQVLNYIQMALTTNQMQQFEYQLQINKKNRYFEARMVASNVDEVLLIVRDVTFQNQFQQALLKSEERYRSILETIEDAYYEVDLTGNLTFFNDSLLRILGYARENLLKMNYRQYMDTKFANKTFNVFNTVFRTGHPAEGFDTEIIRVDGTRRYIEVSVSLIKDFNGTSKGFRGIFRDVTNKIVNQLALRKQKENIALYLDIITHDLNNYHMGSRLNLELALTNVQSQNYEIAHYLQKIIKNNIRGSTLLNSISILMRETYDFIPSKINIYQSIEKVSKTLRAIFPEKTQIDINLENFTINSLVSADTLFDELLLNILTNAVKNNPKNLVQIDIEIQHDINAHESCILVISDYGTGIDHQKRQNIFTRFSEFRKQGKGSGLGLYIVKTLVDRYHGKIWIEDRVPGDFTQGTSINIQFKFICNAEIN